MSQELVNKFADLLKEAATANKPKPSLEEVFQKTLDETTPAEPGDLRQSRKWKDSWTNEDLSEWV